MTVIFKPMSHQTESLKFLARNKRVFDMSDCGTGKTLVQIMDFAVRRKKRGGCALVLCPKSIMRAAWYNDIQKFAPHLKVSLAYANNRKEAMQVDADVYVTNVDGIKDLSKLPDKFWNRFDTLIIDECTTMKHGTSDRSRATKKLIRHFEYRRLMSGTPMSNGICDLHHQMLLLDDGKRLGKSFPAFRAATCIPVQTGPQPNMLKWTDKPGIENVIIDLIKDVVIRHRFEDCVDIPENHQYGVPITLSRRHMDVYNELRDESLAILGKTTVTAINGAALATKLLQTASGAVYDDDGSSTRIATERYELVLDLVEARQHSVVFYTWEHQRDELVKLAKKRKIKHVVWDSSRPEIEKDFQSGKYQVLFAHPQSAGHGLTFTRGTATIWASPTYNLEHYLQGLKRIHRIGQQQKTETIVVIAEGTIDEQVWAMLQAKKVRMDALFHALKEAA